MKEDPIVKCDAVGQTIRENYETSVVQTGLSAVSNSFAEKSEDAQLPLRVSKFKQERLVQRSQHD